MFQEHTIIIGAGPCGISAAIELQKQGITPLIIEQQNIVYSISQYPTYMHFFSTPELLEIGDVPFSTANEKPSRLEALHYYRIVAQRHQLRVNAYETVTDVQVQQEGAGFHVRSRTRHGEDKLYSAKYVVIATGYFDHPNMLGIPGETTEKVTHFFREAHPYTNMKVAIIGGSNSAIDAALELVRVGASVTVVYRGSNYADGIKPWVKPLFESLVKKGVIDMRFSSRTVEIKPASIIVEGPGGIEEIPNDFVLALTGFHPDRSFLSRIGITIESNGYPYFDDATMQTNVPGVYLAGVVASRRAANEIFIETGRFHGRSIAAHIVSLQNT